MEQNTGVKPTVLSVGIKFGFIATLVSVIFFLLLTLLGQNPFDQKWGYVNLLIFSPLILFLAHKTFKDAGDGFMTYGQGVGIGFWISVVGIVIGGIFTYVYVTFVDATIMDLVYEKQAEDMSAKKMTDEQIEMAISWTKKLFWPIYVVFGLFFGVLVALIVTIFTQKKNPEPTF